MLFLQRERDGEKVERLQINYIDGQRNDVRENGSVVTNVSNCEVLSERSRLVRFAPAG